jgi:hypothetical protein
VALFRNLARRRTSAPTTRRGGLIAAVLAAISLVAPPSFAGTLASAILLSTDAQRLDCFVSNVGRAPVAITQLSIVNGGVTILPLTGENCLPVLQPGANCTFSAALDARFSARGLVDVRGSTKHLRGQCQLTTSTNRVVASNDLR